LRLLSFKSGIISSCIYFKHINSLVTPFSYNYFLFINNIFIFFRLFTFFSVSFHKYRSDYYYSICIHFSIRLFTNCLHYYSIYSSYSNYIFFYICYFSILIFFSRLKKGVVSLPTSIKKYTVLRSPHTDKKSREQFEIRSHKRLFYFPSLFSTFYVHTCYLSYSSFLCNYVHTLNIEKHG